MKAGRVRGTGSYSLGDEELSGNMARILRELEA